MINKIKSFFSVKKNSTNNLRIVDVRKPIVTVWLMLCGMSVEDENLIATDIIVFIKEIQCLCMSFYRF